MTLLWLTLATRGPRVTIKALRERNDEETGHFATPHADVARTANRACLRELLLEGGEARQRFRHTASLIPTDLVGFRAMDEVEKVTLCSWISRDQRDRMLQLAERGDRSLSQQVRIAVREHLERAVTPEPDDTRS